MMNGQPQQFIRIAGSLETTMIVLVLFLLAVTWVLWNPLNVTWVIALPLLLLAINLLAAIATNPKFRRQVPLLVFHLTLFVIICLIALGRMTYLKGRAEVSEGAEFDGQLISADAGPWHSWHIEGVRFINQSFQIYYEKGPRRTHTRNRVQWLDDSGSTQEALIGDQHPLVLQGYRFYTTHNKGYAPVFRWRSKSGGESMIGDIHLPPYPANALRQTVEWLPPGGGTKLWFLLQFDEVILTPDAPSVFRPPKVHTLIVREGEQRNELKPGDKVELSQGTLEYLGLRTWMGYNVSYDWTKTWLIATSLVSVLALGWHLWNRFFTRSWLIPEGKQVAD